jgi:hypothetical protein
MSAISIEENARSCLELVHDRPAFRGMLHCGTTAISVIRSGPSQRSSGSLSRVETSFHSQSHMSLKSHLAPADVQFVWERKVSLLR